MRLALYLVLMGLFFGTLGAFARWVLRQGGAGAPGVQSLSLGLVACGPVFFYGGLTALAAGVVLALLTS